MVGSLPDKKEKISSQSELETKMVKDTALFSLTFSATESIAKQVEKLLCGIVGKATVHLGASLCLGCSISNPVPYKWSRENSGDGVCHPHGRPGWISLAPPKQLQPSGKLFQKKANWVLIWKSLYVVSKHLDLMVLYQGTEMPQGNIFTSEKVASLAMYSMG